MNKQVRVEMADVLAAMQMQRNAALDESAAKSARIAGLEKEIEQIKAESTAACATKQEASDA